MKTKKSKSIASVVLAFTMMAGTCALAGTQVQQVGTGDVIIAQRGDYRGDRRDGRYERHDDRRDGRYTHREDRRRDLRNDRIDYRRDRRQAYRDHDRRGAGPRRDLYKGRYLPRYYRTQHYRIRDWRRHGLYAPPRGYYWAQVGADYVLVAITTALIFDLILHH